MGISVVFLDFDGVLNSHRFMLERVGNGDSGGGVMGLDPKAVAHINCICGKTDAVIVVSSSWRYGHTFQQLKDTLAKAGCTAFVLDKTPMPHEIANHKLSPVLADHGLDVPYGNVKDLMIKAYGRGREIDAWLETWKKLEDIEAFVIIDDDLDIAPHLDRHVKTSFADGLTSEHVPLALEILGRPWISSSGKR